MLSEGKPFPTSCLPVEVGIPRQVVEYTCIDASQQFLAVGCAQGYVWVIDLLSSRLLREFSVSSMCLSSTLKLQIPGRPNGQLLPVCVCLYGSDAPIPKFYI